LVKLYLFLHNIDEVDMSEKISSFSFSNPMPPLWLMYPEFDQSCMGWRMGYGESYLIDYFRWLDTLNEQENKDYIALFPEPYDWTGYWHWKIGDGSQGYSYYNEHCLIDLRREDGMPEYDVYQMKKDYREGHKKDLLLFWGHQPSKDGNLTKSCFSQWWMAAFKVNGQVFYCAEQYMMAGKAKLFGDKRIYEEILSCNDPKTIKSLGKEVKLFDEEEWNKVKYSIVLKGNYQKFMMNRDLKAYLLATGESVLVEASPYDTVWGIGLAANDKDAIDPLNWRGSNLLGFALMEVRNEIKRVCRNEHLIHWPSVYQSVKS
jgi:ribA/ribD-fused uncharacterized protein